MVTDNDINEKLAYLLKKSKKQSLVKGFVRIKKDGIIQDELYENIVVGSGRMFIAQKLFNLKYFSDTDYRSYIISHYGFGSGGAIVTGENVSIVSPDSCDLDLYSPIPLCDASSGLSYLTSPGDNIRHINPTPYVAKPLGGFQINFLAASDITCDYGQVHSFIQCDCQKAIGEPTYLVNDDDYIIVNECALYYTNFTNTRLFAHICFPPQYLQKKSDFVVEWFVLC